MTATTLSLNTSRSDVLRPGLRGCALPNDHALALAIVPSTLAKCLRTFFTRWHWTLECTESFESGLELMRSRSAAVVFCEASCWNAVLAVANQLEHPPLVLVVAEQPNETDWVEALTAGAFYLEANPLRMTSLFPLLNHAWCVWNQR